MIDVIVIILLVVMFLYIIWITGVLHNMIQGLYKSRDEL